MPIRLQCKCGKRLKAPSEFTGKQAECPDCGRVVVIPQPDQPIVATAVEEVVVATVIEPADLFGFRAAAPGEGITFLGAEEPTDVVEFLEPPSSPVERRPSDQPPWWQRMLMSLLDPRSIHWMLTLGGGLMVLGLIIWLVSLGLFKDPRILAAVLTLGAAAIHATGCWLAITTRYKTIGRALTFLGCVLVPMNLWFYHAQGLVTLDGLLWVGGAACCLLYVATVVLLRDPLFMYAVEAGVTLTGVLLLGNVGLLGDSTYYCFTLLALSLVSIHAERMFPLDAECFSRPRYGLPLFWCGHAQLGIALILLGSTQALDLFLDPLSDVWGLHWVGNLLTHSSWLAGALWLVGAYAYLYSDIVVRRVGVYVYLAATCFALSLVTLAGFAVDAEWLIVILALAGLVVHAAHRFSPRNDRLTRQLPILSQILSVAAVVLGVVLHVRATSNWLDNWHFGYATTWWFVAALLTVAVCNRISALLEQRSGGRRQAFYLFLSAAGVVVGAAGLLRMIGMVEWPQQATLLMLIPIAYLIAARLWRDRGPARPLGVVAHVATGVILAHVLLGAIRDTEQFIAPVTVSIDNLLLGLVFAEATVFYTLAAILRRKSQNVYFAAAAACGAVWQLMCYWQVPGPYYSLLYAALGFGMLVAARFVGIEMVERYERSGKRFHAARGRGLTLLQAGSSVLAVALIAACMQGLVRLISEQVQWWPLAALAVTATLGAIAIWLTPSSVWRSFFMVISLALTGVIALSLYALIDLTFWQTLEIVSVALGIVLLAAGHVGRFRERDNRPDDQVTLGLWFGSCLAALPLLIAVLYHRFISDAGWSLPDELALLTVTILMLATGYSWQVKATTLIGGVGLTLHVVMLIISLAIFPQVAVGVYLAVGGALLFLVGVGLSVYRERLLTLPQKIAKREGVFRVMSWR